MHQSPEVAPHTFLQLQQPRFCTERIFLYTGNKQTFTWKEAGISLHFRESSCTTQIKMSVAIIGDLDETYILPEGKPLISAMYKITASDTLPAPVKIRIHHCVQLMPCDEPLSKSVTFIVAHDGRWIGSGKLFPKGHLLFYSFILRY